MVDGGWRMVGSCWWLMMRMRSYTRITHRGDPVHTHYIHILFDLYPLQVQKLDPKAPDELLILAKGKSVESWRLAEIKRDDYSPNPQVRMQCGLKEWGAVTSLPLA